ncbi:MAG: ROK family protein [Acidobacteria bacterium]|nr:ROK family protein [Acidobacteriota bacterium]
MDWNRDQRIVLTLDAGGTNLVFDAIQGGRPILAPLGRSTPGHDLDACLSCIVGGFQTLWDRLPQAPSAISFAFPGPADYRAGIIEAQKNLPAFRGGVPLGPLLEERFGLPVFINNDGDLFAFGEALAGLLPEVNGALAQAGSPRRHRNLFGITLGTGFGGGLVGDGRLFLGDNGSASEIWSLRNGLDPALPAEEGASIRALRRGYADLTGLSPEAVPEPRILHQIARGEAPGDPRAAREAFRRLGEVAGDAVASATAIVDGLVVVGGGLAGAADLILPALVGAMNGTLRTRDGDEIPRLESRAFNLDDPEERRLFLAGDLREVPVPGSTRRVTYDRLKRIGVGRSRLGTSRAVAVGAYAFALEALDSR